MFVYQNANRDICVTFASNKPVKDPEYVISIDHDAGTISVNGELMEAVSTETEENETTETESDSQPETTEPVVEETTEPSDKDEDEAETEEE